MTRIFFVPIQTPGGERESTRVSGRWSKDDTGERASRSDGSGVVGDIQTTGGNNDSTVERAAAREDVRVIDRSRRRRRTNVYIRGAQERTRKRRRKYTKGRGNASLWRVAITYDVARSATQRRPFLPYSDARPFCVLAVATYRLRILLRSLISFDPRGETPRKLWREKKSARVKVSVQDRSICLLTLATGVGQRRFIEISLPLFLASSFYLLFF